MQNLGVAQKLKPRLMSVSLMIAKASERAKISCRLIHQDGIDTRIKFVAVDKGKPTDSEALNKIITDICEKKSGWVKFDGEFIRLVEEVATEKLATEEKEFAADLSEDVAPEEKELAVTNKKKKSGK